MKILLSLFLLFASSFATAASNSNPGLYYGQVPTAAQWNSYFSSKLDYVPGAANTIPYWDGSGNIINAPVSGNCTSAANVFTCIATGADGLTVQVSNNANYYPLFVASTTNSTQPFNLGTGLSFNPSTNTLTTTNFVGALTGTASGNVVIGGALGTPASGTLTNVTGLPLSGLTTQASNTVVGNATASSASPTALTMPTCFGSTSALLWTPNSGYSCNSSISANTSTNISGGTQYGVLYQSASGTTASTAAGTAGYVLTSNGTSAPTFQSTSATIYDPTNVAITGGTIGGITVLGVAGDVTITGANALRGSYGGGGITSNFASGDGALYSNTTGNYNTANGMNALYSNTVGNLNTANGVQALYSNTIGTNNTANGVNVLYSNTVGSDNTAIGQAAGFTATTANANVSGNNNTWIGYQAGPGVATQLNNATALGNGALNTASNQVVLGNSAVTSNVIYGGLTLNNNLLFSSTAPTIASGFGTSPSIVWQNGTATFLISVGTGGTATNGTITMPAATNSWSCIAQNQTLNALALTTLVGIPNNTSLYLTSYNSSGVSTAWPTNTTIKLICVGI